MSTNAQLDNEKQAFMYTVEDLKVIGSLGLEDERAECLRITCVYDPVINWGYQIAIMYLCCAGCMDIHRLIIHGTHCIFTYRLDPNIYSNGSTSYH